MATTTVTEFNPKLSLYIPRIDTRAIPRWEREDVVSDFIARQFHELSIGKIHRVDLLKKTDQKGFVFYAAFCHFEEWYDTEEAKALQNDIKDPEVKAKLQFHEKWFWIVNENTKPICDEDAKLNRAIYEHERTIASLREEVQFLRRQLDARDQQIFMLMERGNTRPSTRRERDVARLHSVSPPPPAEDLTAFEDELMNGKGWEDREAEAQLARGRPAHSRSRVSHRRLHHETWTPPEWINKSGRGSGNK